MSKKEISYEWVIVFAAFLGMLTTSIPLYSFGVFIEPLADTFGWRMAFIYSGILSVVLLTLATYLMESPPPKSHVHVEGSPEEETPNRDLTLPASSST